MIRLSNEPWERSVLTLPAVWYDDVFTAEELQTLIDYCESKGLERAKAGVDPEYDPIEMNRIRRCDIKFHEPTEETAWFFERMNGVIESINSQFYGFDLNGYNAFQYTSYDAAEAGTYHWHMDTFLGPEVPSGMNQPRKLSITVALNDDYEGGEFMINLGEEQHAREIPLIKGRVLAFPSFMIHSVKPVTKGFRKSAVIWVVGPKFK